MDYKIGEYKNLSRFDWKRPKYGFYLEKELIVRQYIDYISSEFGETKIPVNKEGEKLFTDNPLLLVNPESDIHENYNPLEDSPALFLNFAKLSHDPEKILQFANKYGSLSGGRYGYSVDVEC
jgi:hypothetical protein